MMWALPNRSDSVEVLHSDLYVLCPMKLTWLFVILKHADRPPKDSSRTSLTSQVHAEPKPRSVAPCELVLLIDIIGVHSMLEKFLKMLKFTRKKISGPLKVL